MTASTTGSTTASMTSEAAYSIAAEHSEATEQLGHLHPDVVAALIDAGIFKQWASTAVGGANASVTDGLRTIEAASRADGATGWCVMIANTTALTSHRLTEPWASKIFAALDACTGGFGMPAGTARIVDGGLRVTGRWAWGSGTDHCTWIGGGVRVVDEEGKATRTADGAFAPFVFFEPSDVQLLDTWHVSGLKGTASTDYAVEEVFVPEGRWVQLVGADADLHGSLARFPFFGALGAGVAAVLIGLGERAVDELVALGEKKSTGSKRTLAERATVQSDLARAKANIGQARSWLHSCANELSVQAATDAPIPEAARVQLRLAATTAAQRSLEAVDLCYHAAGSSVVYTTSPLQRVFRDAHVAITHGMVAPRTLEPLGRYGFGLPTDTSLL